MGMHFNPDKCIFKQKKIPFFGMLVGENGIEPDPQKIADLKSLPIPTTAKLLQSFLGIVNYLARFSPNIAKLTELLRQLLCKNAEFIWLPNHTKAFNVIKEELCGNTDILSYYRPGKKLFLEVDASLLGLGCALLQPKSSDEHELDSLVPIAYGSKTLNETEKCYANIECEMLAVTFGLKKFHYYCFGWHTIILSDHKPLVAILQKDLCNAPPRLQRMLLSCQQYSYEINYRKGSDMIFTDHLSCNASAQSNSDDECVNSLERITIASVTLNVSDDRLKQLQSENMKDPEMIMLQHMVIEGWPQKRTDVSSLVSKYWNYRDKVSILDGVLLKGHRVIIPQNMREVVLSQLHEGHLGISKCKLRARNSVFWPGLNSEIEEKIGSCKECNTHALAQTKSLLEPMHNELPRCAWSKLSADVFHYESKHYLLIVDQYSKFIVVREIMNETSDGIIKEFTKVFELLGVAHSLLTDNAACFKSEAFKEFCKYWDLEHVTISAYHHQGNAYVE